MSIKFSLLATPTLSIKFLMALGVKPNLRIPEMVGILGSSQPVTTFSATKRCNFLLEVIM